MCVGRTASIVGTMLVREPLRDQQGRIVQWYGVSVDIDEAKKAEERLRRSETYLAEAQRLSHSGVAAYNETAISMGRRRHTASGGLTRRRVFRAAKPCSNGSTPTTGIALNGEVERAVSEKRDYKAAYRIVLPDGTIKHIEVIGRPAFCRKRRTSRDCHYTDRCDGAQARRGSIAYSRGRSSRKRAAIP